VKNDFGSKRLFVTAKHKEQNFSTVEVVKFFGKHKHLVFAFWF